MKRTLDKAKMPSLRDKYYGEKEVVTKKEVKEVVKEAKKEVTKKKK